MTHSSLRSFSLAALFLFLSASIASAETIIKVNLGPTGPDVQLKKDGSTVILSTVDDGKPSPGAQDTNATFHGFVSTNGLVDISGGSFTLSGIEMSGAPVGGVLVSQETSGGMFALYDSVGTLLLEGELTAGSIVGTSGSSATGAFLTANVGKFTGPTSPGLTQLYNMLEPASASLAISLTDVISSGGAGGPVSGLAIGSDGNLLNFVADASAQIGAESQFDPLPEPTASVMAVLGVLGVCGFRRRRR